MSEIEIELQNASKIFPYDDEERETYLHRLLQGVAELDDAEWESLTEGSQAWFNSAVTAHNNKDNLPRFPDSEEEEEDKEPEPKDFKTMFLPEPSLPEGRGHGISKITDDLVITINTKKNPKRPGSRSHDEFSLYKDGMTVKEYLSAGGSRAGVRWDYNKEFIKLS